uniref:Uncharacterized protein n=1 Tax=Chromera velia CCMP2878 TaxID=1169474 RepID=A0A0G4FU11_9ALVE|eukprot:Cvel_18801.t1-p1 / transcript=Cvel_18801.t1 / gene=Cvel_18801 / organism=Chromera_velia_CCMP2878 / gene_product=hypothetical protein / transcript_product=hypothetical protein / location=Cvel_scaffold1579:6905-7427(-) / protein_length=146 / sequence_SO=supercontig / SO=protein_coding / is_pseudo=false
MRAYNLIDKVNSNIFTDVGKKVTVPGVGPRGGARRDKFMKDNMCAFNWKNLVNLSNYEEIQSEDDIGSAEEESAGAHAGQQVSETGPSSSSGPTNSRNPLQATKRRREGAAVEIEEGESTEEVIESGLLDSEADLLRAEDLLIQAA